MLWKEINKGNFQEVMEIYQDGINTGIATFETTLPEWESWDKTHLPYGRIALYENKITAWGALSPVSSRCVYGGVAELSVYVSKQFRRKGHGQRVLNKLIEISEANNIWTLQASIFRENKASCALHINCGFREIGYREKIGCLNGVWHDNILFERRSSRIF